MQEPRIITTLDGVTTAIVAFLFLCLAMPKFVKNKTQYYAALAAVLLVILLHALTVVLSSSTGLVMLFSFFIAVLQIAAIVMLVLCVGGMTVSELTGDLSNAYEVIRRGEEKKEVIIPLHGQPPRPKDDDSAGDAPPVVNLEMPPPKDKPANSSIPLE